MRRISPTGFEPVFTSVERCRRTTNPLPMLVFRRATRSHESPPLLVLLEMVSSGGSIHYRALSIELRADGLYGKRTHLFRLDRAAPSPDGSQANRGGLAQAQER